jgi:hypothetical protein
MLLNIDYRLLAKALATGWPLSWWASSRQPTCRGAFLVCGYGGCRGLAWPHPLGDDTPQRHVHSGQAKHIQHVSARLSISDVQSGMRLGCPWPLLYLFAAWALSCWLKEYPALGVEAMPRRMGTVVCEQFVGDA